jgi:hypothetical protein
MAALIEANAAAAPSSLSGVSFVSWDQQLFDPIELQGDDLRDAKLVTRKQTLHPKIAWQRLRNATPA